MRERLSRKTSLRTVLICGLALSAALAGIVSTGASVAPGRPEFVAEKPASSTQPARTTVTTHRWRVTRSEAWRGRPRQAWPVLSEFLSSPCSPSASCDCCGVARRRPTDVGGGHAHHLQIAGDTLLHRLPAHAKIVGLVTFALAVVATPAPGWSPEPRW